MKPTKAQLATWKEQAIINLREQLPVNAKIEAILIKIIRGTKYYRLFYIEDGFLYEFTGRASRITKGSAEGVTVRGGDAHDIAASLGITLHNDHKAFRVHIQ